MVLVEEQPVQRLGGESVLEAGMTQGSWRGVGDAERGQ